MASIHRNIPDSAGLNVLRADPAMAALLEVYLDPAVHDAIASELTDVVAAANQGGWGSQGKLSAADRDVKTAEICAQLASTVGPLL